MNSKDNKEHPDVKPDLSPQAKRAREEAKLRRENPDKSAPKPAVEINGREGLEPTRYGDWEKKGLISDF